jgi:hypothetical protein
MLRRCLLVLACLPALAQVPAPMIPVNGIASDLNVRQLGPYLSLTDAQILQLSKNINEYNQLFRQRQTRISQVESEIRSETAKSPLDPAALGVRYVEIEAICRNVQAELAALVKRNVALLTEVQVTKLKALDDASKLLPIVIESQTAGVLGPPNPVNYTASARPSLIAYLGIYSGGGIDPATLSGCQQSSQVN